MKTLEKNSDGFFYDPQILIQKSEKFLELLAAAYPSQNFTRNSSKIPFFKIKKKKKSSSIQNNYSSFYVSPKKKADDIIDHIAKKHKITPVEIRGERRDAHILAARYDAYESLSEMLGWSTTHIGRFLNRDRTTVINGLKRIKQFRFEGKWPIKSNTVFE